MVGDYKIQRRTDVAVKCLLVLSKILKEMFALKLHREQLTPPMQLNNAVNIDKPKQWISEYVKFSTQVKVVNQSIVYE